MGTKKKTANKKSSGDDNKQLKKAVKALCQAVRHSRPADARMVQCVDKAEALLK